MDLADESVLATLPDHVEVGGDPVRPYVLLMNSHDGSTAVIAATTPIRRVRLLAESPAEKTRALQLVAAA